MINVATIFTRVGLVEQRYCIWINRISENHLVRAFFVLISRLGDGILWYSLIATLPLLQGKEGLLPVLHILVTGIVCLSLYKFLKPRLLRERPYISCINIKRAAPALDQYSFPSGHTMHAVTFSTCLSFYAPQLGAMVWGFTLLIATSRVVLGLHYPTDVAAGAALGYGIASISLALI